MTRLYDIFKAWGQANPNTPKSSSAKGASWNQRCALGISIFIRNNFGWSSEGGTWGPGAWDVGRNSGWLNPDWRSAPVGAFHFWNNGTYGHAGIDLNGGGTAVGMFGTAKIAVQFAPYIGVQTVLGYNTANYKGWSKQYGGKTFPVPADSIPVAANQRKIISSSPARIRPKTNIIDSQIGLIPANTIINPIGWLYGDIINTNDIWLKISYNGINGFIHSSTVTLANNSGLPDVNPIDPYKKKNKNSIANIREYASIKTKILSTIFANDPINIESYGEGENVNGNNVWFKLKDAKGFIHSSVLTDPSIEGIKKEEYESFLKEYYAPSIEGWKLGVDLSGYQNGFNFKEYKNGENGIVIHKMGGGNTSSSPYIAPKYLEHLNASREAGITGNGHYWFNGHKNGLDAKSSAEFFIKNISLEEGDFLILDIEDEKASETKAFTPDEVLVFAQTVKDNLGIDIIIYMSLSLAKNSEWDKVSAALPDSLWVASWGKNDGKYYPVSLPIGSWKRIVGQQFTAINYTKSVPGWPKEDLDRNIFNESLLEKFRYKKIAPPIIVEPQIPPVEPPIEPEHPEPPIIIPEPSLPPSKPVLKGSLIGAIVVFGIAILSGIISFFGG